MASEVVDPGSEPTNGTSHRSRRPRDREKTESELLEAAWEILQRDGVLAGVNLKRVAEYADVNRSLIYRYFGSREALLQAALRWRNENTAGEFEHGRQLPFLERRMHAWSQVLLDPTYGNILAHLAMSGDTDFKMMPFIEHTRRSLEHDRETGALPDDIDGEVAHALSVATYAGYSVFRNALARELDLSPEELDTRATRVFEKMMQGITTDGDQGHD